MKALRHWMLHNDIPAQEFDAILKLSPGYNPVRLIDPAVSFFASLLTNTNDVRGKVGNFSRASTGIYRASDGKLAEAVANISRHEWQGGAPIGLLMEPASTNKCENWNANPDDELVNVDPPAFRILDTEKIREAKLDRVCSSGYAICIDNTGGGSSIVCLVGGSTGNTNNHVYGGYGRVDQGEGRINQSGGGTPFVSFTSQSYERKHVIRDPGAGARQLVVQAQPNSKCYFLLNQLEEQPVITSPIITKGIATSRAADVLNWSSDQIWNATQGMLTVQWQPRFSNTDITTGIDAQHWIVDIDPAAARPIYFVRVNAGGENRFYSYDGVNAPFISLSPAVVADQLYLIALRWTIGTLQIGFKTAGVWSWGTASSYSGGFDGSDTITQLFPYGSNFSAGANARDLTLWTEDRGTAWLENYYSDVAN